MTWEQIADFFPGRNAGTLQVRYCTHLKESKSKEEMIEKAGKLIDKHMQKCWQGLAKELGQGTTVAEAQKYVKIAESRAKRQCDGDQTDAA